MTDETILKLMTSPIEEDVVIGANYLIKRPLRDIISFYEKYGEDQSEIIQKVNGFYSYCSLKGETHSPFLKIIQGEKLIWVGGTDSYILDPSEFSSQIESWHDKTI